MIIGVLILTVIITIVTWTTIKSNVIRMVCGIISLLTVLAATIILTLNFTNHLGMQKKTTSSVQQIYSTGQKSSPAGMIIVKPLGTAHNSYVAIYRTQKNAKATAHFVPNTKNVVNAAKTTANYHYSDTSKATVTTKVTKWRWQSDTWRFWLNVGDQDGQLVQKHSEINLPKQTWIALTAKQAKQLQIKQNSSKSTGSQENLKIALSSKMKVYQKSHPKATEKQIQTYQQQELAKLSIQSIRQIINES